jgi:hypothetical protein
LDARTSDVDVGDELAQANPVAVDAEKIMSRVRGALFDSFETLSSEENEQLCAWLRDYPHACAHLLDDHISKLLVGRVPEMVRRILRFEPIATAGIPDTVVNVFLQEAVRSYLYGHFQAAVALARAAVEHALRATVPYAAVGNWTLDTLIEAAGRFKLLDAAELQLATEVQHAGNRVLHRQACDETVAFDTLVKSRGVLEVLWGNRQG